MESPTAEEFESSLAESEMEIGESRGEESTGVGDFSSTTGELTGDGRDKPALLNFSASFFSSALIHTPLPLRFFNDWMLQLRRNS